MSAYPNPTNDATITHLATHQVAIDWSLWGEQIRWQSYCYDVPDVRCPIISNARQYRDDAIKDGLRFCNCDE
jgi:hypothetical protein